MEPKELHPGVLMARTLLSTDAETTRVRVINCGRVPCTLSAGELLATAETADGCLVAENDNPSNADYMHVQCLVEKLPAKLTEEQPKQAGEFIKSYAHVFSRSATGLGRNRMMPHRINTGNYSPVKEPLRRQPYAYLHDIERNVQEMVAAKVIEPAQ